MLVLLVHVFVCLPCVQAKLQSMKRYVFELKESYDELLRAFNELKLTLNPDNVMELKKKLNNKEVLIKV